ncbi:hypothetical protein Syun_019138 [Stephania yunnanensis]|uniref:Uncharacterized protein n=1 Tax=Stephania yunnanensis TaxID=152371 RepID=A0AAP0ITK3_9MAGN
MEIVRSGERESRRGITERGGATQRQGSRQWLLTAELCDSARRRDEAAWAQPQRRPAAAVESGDQQRPDCETTASSGDAWSGSACESAGDSCRRARRQRMAGG